MRTGAFLLPLLLIFGCHSGSTVSDRVFKIEGIVFNIPEDDIADSLVTAGDTEYLRIERKRSYQLTYSKLLLLANRGITKKIDLQADAVKGIGLNNTDLYHIGSDHTVRCTRVDLHLNCGAIVFFKNTMWSIDFDRKDLKHANYFIGDALSYLYSHWGN